MTALSAENLVEAFAAKARRQLDEVGIPASRYAALARAAAISQDLGNMLSREIYAASHRERRTLACAAGCNTCCHIPGVPQVTTTDFTMTVLDFVTLIENAESVASVEIRAETPLSAGDMLHRIASDTARPAVVPCPNLAASGGCAIYPIRPVTCKIWFSADVELCRTNLRDGYRPGVNPLTDQSDVVRTAFEKPFAAWVGDLAPAVSFRGYDFLTAFRMAVNLAPAGAAGSFRQSINAGLSILAAYRTACSVS